MVIANKNQPRTYSEYKWTIYTWYVLHTMALYAEQELEPIRKKEQKEQKAAAKANTKTTIKRRPRLNHPGKKYVKFFSTFWKQLPCPDCTEHYQSYLRANPLSKKTDFHVWTVGLHNNVNKRIGNRTYTAEQARHFYLLEGKLEIDWWYYYFMVKTFANVAYTNGDLSQFCRTLDLLRQVVPSKSLRSRLPMSKDLVDKKIFIRRYLIALKKKMDAVEPRIKQLRFTKGN